MFNVGPEEVRLARLSRLAKLYSSVDEQLLVD